MIIITVSPLVRTFISISAQKKTTYTLNNTFTLGNKGLSAVCDQMSMPFDFQFTKVFFQFIE